MIVHFEKGRRKLALVFGRPEIGEFVRASLGLRSFGEHTTIGLVNERDILAGVVYNDYQPACGIQLHIAASGLWAIPEFISEVFAYPFLQLDCKRCTAMVKAGNVPSRRMVERVGFTQEGVCKYGFADDDAVIYGMYRETCDWIRNGKRLRQFGNPSRPVCGGGSADQDEQRHSAVQRAA